MGWNGLVALSLLLASVPASAETIQGRWKLTAAEDVRADGSVARYPWGRHPVGSIVVDGGACYVQIMSSDVRVYRCRSAGARADEGGVVEHLHRILGSVHHRRSRGQRDAESRGGVASRLRRHGAEALLSFRWRPAAVRSEQPPGPTVSRLKGARAGPASPAASRSNRAALHAAASCR